jgi:hypothetical protein
MPHRIVHLAHPFGMMLDIGVFGTALGLIFGLSPSEYGTLMAGIGTFLLGLGRGYKLFQEGQEARARARWQETFSDPAVFKKLERLKCYNAPECEEREFFAPDNQAEQPS